MEPLELQHIVRAIIQGSAKPLNVKEIMLAFTDDANITAVKVQLAIEDLLAMEDPVHELQEIAGGYRYQIKSQYAPWLQKAQGQEALLERPSRVLNEVLAIIAYKQPITRGEIDLLRGASTHLTIFQQLEERGWIKIVAYGGTNKRAALYGTTSEFLAYFGLNSVYDLPVMEEISI